MAADIRAATAIKAAIEAGYVAVTVDSVDFADMTDRGRDGRFGCKQGVYGPQRN